MARWLAAAVAVLVMSAVRARADDFSDFRIPAHRAYVWDVGGSADGGRFRTNGPGTSYRNDGVNGSISTRAFRLFDSDPRRTSLVIVGDAVGRRTSGRTEDLTEPQTRLDRVRSRLVAEGWSVSLQHRQYPWSVPAGVELSGSGRGNYVQDWERTESREASPTTRLDQLRHLERWDYLNEVDGGAAVGWGRVRDATGVYDARVLEERLQRAGALSHPLSAGARRHLAELLYGRSDFDQVPERPAKYLWREVGRILREDGALPEGDWDPWAWISAFGPYLGAGRAYPRDLVPASPVLRFTGVFIGPVIVASHLSRVQRTDTELQSLFFEGDSLAGGVFGRDAVRNAITVDEAFAGAKGEVHHPLDARWQADAAAQVVFPLKHTPHGLVVISSGSLRFIRPDRWNAGVSIAQSRSIQKRGLLYGKSPGNGWSVEYAADLAYYLEDCLTLSLLVSEEQNRNVRFRRDGRVSLGLTYRILGHFEAPGLMEPFDIHHGAP